MSDDKERFLSRWSRRKVEATREAVAPKPLPAVPPAIAQGAAQPELPSVETLRGLASEYKEFLRPGVDEDLRRSALKRLFRDPHFNVMDGLDVYIDDYSKPDPIPDAMMRTLAHARSLLFDDKKEEPQAPAERPALSSAPDVRPAPESPAPEAALAPPEDDKA
ncbi:MAG TPA: DUF3306 domain-containing protein [Burkholderiales bacterium]|nr:DUF3306 domain-containing protein [Burkholderiales bacterium]